MAGLWLVWGTGALVCLSGCGGQGGVARDSGDAAPSDAMPRADGGHEDARGDSSRPARDGSAADTGGGCPGVPLVTSNTGYVAPATNSVDIHGSWFVYSDCDDQG